MIFLASPYSDPDPLVRKARFEAVADRAARLLAEGELVYAPVVYGHALAERGLPGDFNFWAKHSRTLLEMSDALAALALPGWQESVGVRAELAVARSFALPVRFEDPHDARATGTC